MAVLLVRRVALRPRRPPLRPRRPALALRPWLFCSKCESDDIYEMLERRLRGRLVEGDCEMSFFDVEEKGKGKGWRKGKY